MIETFRRWFMDHRRALEQNGISLDLTAGSEGLPKNGVSALLASDRFEAAVELWETGESEFYFSDWTAADRDPNVGVEVTHHDFANTVEMSDALNDLINRMSPALASR